MKPDWNDAPEWAWWLVMDGDGYWFWHEYKPEFVPADGNHLDFWRPAAGGRKTFARGYPPSPVNTLEARP